MRKDQFTLFLWLCLSVLAKAGQCAPHPFSVQDILEMERISDPQVSPDGSRIIFVQRSTDFKANRGRTDIWQVHADGSRLTRLTTATESDVNPRWSSDGKEIWFLSGRSGSSQVWALPVHGGEARQVTDLPLDVGNLVVSGDGRHIAFTVDVFPEMGSIDQTVAKLDELAHRQASGRIYDALFVRHWDTWKDGRRSHLFAMNLETKDLVNVMGPRGANQTGMDADTPSRPFGGPEEIVFTPDGRGIVFSARDAGPNEAWSTDFDLYLASLDGSQPPQCLTAQNRAWDTHPLFSPDGKTLAYLAMAKPGYESDRLRVVLQSWPQGRKRVLTANWDRSPSSFCFSPDSLTIYATAANVGQVSLYAIDLKTGRITPVVKEGVVRSPIATHRKIFYSHCSLAGPSELHAIDLDSGKEKAITHINAPRLAEVKMGEYEQFSFKGWQEETVYAYVVKPVDFDPSQTYPVAFLIHGGPQGSFNNTFHYRWNAQAYAGAGYAAVMVDFHGSTGYGQAFTDSIRGDWGGKPLEDLQKGLHAALVKYPWMDPERVGALGASFGGYMINWIAGNWPDRFRCLVNHDGNLDERMAYYDTEELWFPEWDHMGTPWNHPDHYEKHNPVNYVQHWKTPMLVIHGALDYRVVDTQGLAAFNALQRKGIPSKLLYFPDENHWVLRPHNSILWHNTVIDWLDQWLKPSTNKLD
jgi:dipeptidyl aminopeptidase/acylaminoacyl peptidase